MLGRLDGATHTLTGQQVLACTARLLTQGRHATSAAAQEPVGDAPPDRCVPRAAPKQIAGRARLYS
jgi:hypothetical protein